MFDIPNKDVKIINVLPINPTNMYFLGKVDDTSEKFWLIRIKTFILDFRLHNIALNSLNLIRICIAKIFIRKPFALN